MRTMFAMTMLAATAACAAPTANLTAPRTSGATIPVPSGSPVSGAVDKLIGRDARSLVAQFGAAKLDIVEAGARKLQFVGEACILDAYLYAPSRGKEAVVTHVDARLLDGRDTDRARCAAALTKQR